MPGFSTDDEDEVETTAITAENAADILKQINSLER